jgi:hypothetical protein
VFATQRKQRPLRGKEKIGIAVGKVLGRYKMAKYFELTIEESVRFISAGLRRMSRSSLPCLAAGRLGMLIEALHRA